MVTEESERVRFLHFLEGVSPVGAGVSSLSPGTRCVTRLVVVCAPSSVVLYWELVMYCSSEGWEFYGETVPPGRCAPPGSVPVLECPVFGGPASRETPGLS